MSMNVRVGGVWKAATPSVKVAGVWKPVASGWVRVAGVWRKFYPDALPTPAVTLYASGSIFNTNAGDKAVTITPAVGDLIVVIAAATGNNNPLCSDDQGGTYTIGVSCLKGAGADAMTCWIRNSLVTSATPHVITSGQSGSTGGGLFALKVVGLSATGAAAKRAAANQHNITSGTPAPVLGGVPLTKNPIIGAVFSPSATLVTQRAGYTELAETSYSVPGAGIEIMSRDSGETSATITWGSAPGGASFGALAIELSAP